MLPGGVDVIVKQFAIGIGYTRSWKEIQLRFDFVQIVNVGSQNHPHSTCFRSIVTLLNSCNLPCSANQDLPLYLLRIKRSLAAKFPAINANFNFIIIEAAIMKNGKSQHSRLELVDVAEFRIHRID